MSHHNSSSSSNSYYSGSNRGRGGGRRGYSRSSGGGGGSGRGEYFKNKYGRGVGSSWSGDLLNPTSTSPTTSNTSTGGPTTREETVVPSRHYTSAVPPTTAISQELMLQRLRQMDGRTYSAYRSLENCIIQNSDHAYTLYVGDKVQPDPFAPPTKFRMVIPSDIVQLPHELCLKDKVGRVATSDFLHRLLYQHLQNNCTSNNATLVLMATPMSQYVLEQTATYVTSTGDVISQFVIPLPARGRTITSSAAIHIFDTILPSMAQTLLSYPKEQLIHHIYCVQDQHWLRLQLPSHNLVAFVANGSILPRASGADDSPKSKEHAIPPDTSQKEEEEEKQEDVAVPFQSPSSHKYTFHLPYTKQTITGMGIPRGITLIVGGGYHGKSTLLQALQVGMYNKVLGDGREYTVCLDETVKIRAEDKRAISSVDISTFIHSNHLPFPNRRNPNTTTTNTSCFSTKEASGSTSQAAIIMEALEMGAKTFLIDEDTCATNFMIRDKRMAQLIPRNKEPITPLLHRIKSLFEDLGVSSILVMGGSGDYFAVADLILWMDSYVCKNVTARAKEIYNATTAHHPNNNKDLHLFSKEKMTTFSHRYLNLSNLDPQGKVSARSKSVIHYGNIELDLSGLEQIVGLAQTKAILGALQILAASSATHSRNATSALSHLFLRRKGNTTNNNTSVTLLEALKAIDDLIDQDGLNALATRKFDGDLARPRIFEIGCAINRLRVDEILSQQD